MSRTTRKNIRFGICTGSNTEWYRARTRTMRRKYSNNMRHLLNNFDIEEVSALILNPKFPKKDSWNEPTDGTRLITIRNANDYEEYVKEVNRSLRFYKKNKRGFNRK